MSMQTADASANFCVCKDKMVSACTCASKVCTCVLYIQVHALICTFSYVRVVKPAWCNFAAMSL